jgi:hypothetical protein
VVRNTLLQPPAVPRAEPTVSLSENKRSFDIHTGWLADGDSLLEICQPPLVVSQLWTVRPTLEDRWAMPFRLSKNECCPKQPHRWRVYDIPWLFTICCSVNVVPIRSEPPTNAVVALKAFMTGCVTRVRYRRSLKPARPLLVVR